MPTDHVSALVAYAAAVQALASAATRNLLAVELEAADATDALVIEAGSDGSVVVTVLDREMRHLRQYTL